MKLTPTQKNFRKQMKKIDFEYDNTLSYRTHNKTVSFKKNKIKKKKKPKITIFESIKNIFNNSSYIAKH